LSKAEKHRQGRELNQHNMPSSPSSSSSPERAPAEGQSNKDGGGQTKKDTKEEQTNADSGE